MHSNGQIIEFSASNIAISVQKNLHLSSFFHIRQNVSFSNSTFTRECKTQSYFTMARLGFGTYLRDGISNISVGKSGRCNEVECPPRVPLKNHGIDESQASYEGHHSPERLGQAAIALTSLIAHVLLLLLCLQGTKLKNNINAMTKGFLPQKRSHKGSTNCLLFCQNNLTDMQDTQLHYFWNHTSP